MWRGITPEVKHGVSVSRSINHFYYLARLPHRHHHRLHCLHLFLHRDSKNLLDKSKKVLSLLKILQFGRRCNFLCFDKFSIFQGSSGAKKKIRER